MIERIAALPLLLLLSLLAGLVGCDDAASLDALTAEHAARTGLDYLDCGSVSPDNRDCPAPVEAPVTCLIDAFGSCTPARLQVNWVTTEGDPLPAVYLVEPGETGACSVISYQDHSADAFKGDYGDVTRFACDAIVTEDVCIGFATDQCVQTGDW